MAIPDYFGRNAVAVAQAISGLDEQRLESILKSVTVGIRLGADAQGPEGAASADLLVRLIARLYPRITIQGPKGTGVADDLAALAASVNPAVDIGGDPTIEIVLGSRSIGKARWQRIFAGSEGWEGRVSTRGAVAFGETDIPFGPGIAACLASANLFRACFLPEVVLDNEASFNPLADGELTSHRERLGGRLPATALIGAGAIGNAAAWALSRTQMQGSLDIVDHEAVDLGNLQRYVLAERDHVGQRKSPLLAGHFSKKGIVATPVESDLASYLEASGYAHESMLLALDSARDRKAAQASLPKWIANAWTQPRDLGVSVHDFVNGACVSCLYMPDKAAPSEDTVIADALGVPDRLMEVRTLLHKNQGATRSFLEAVGAAHGLAMERLVPFENRPLRSLYVEGFCGGGLIPLDKLGIPRGDVHVPLAHQSALAGVLLAAASARYALGGATGSQVTQLDVLRPVAQMHTRPAAKHSTAMCICQDPDYRRVYSEKYGFACLGAAAEKRSTPRQRKR